MFAAIVAHGFACAELEAHIPVLAAAEQAAWHAPRGQRRAANARLKQEYATQGRFCDLLGAATERFVATVPHTLEGAAAALGYVRAHYAGGYPVCEEEECITLLAGTPGIRPRHRLSGRLQIGVSAAGEVTPTSEVLDPAARGLSVVLRVGTWRSWRLGIRRREPASTPASPSRARRNRPSR